MRLPSEPQSPAESIRKPTIFISYERDTHPDETIALQIYEALNQQHQVFIDQTMLVGTVWAEHIEAELRRADVLIALLSARSVHSEMVEAEIAAAHHLSRAQGGRPAILPVRVAYREPFQYPLNAYLDHLNWVMWDELADTPRLLDELKSAIAGRALPRHGSPSGRRLLQISEATPLPSPFPAAQPATLELPEGTMDPQSAFYVVRRSDEIALETIGRQGVTITMKGPRQMGKSSLLLRTMAAATTGGKRVAFLDFQLFERAALAHADRFFRQFCALLTHKLKMEERVEEYWSLDLGNSQCCTLYVSDYLLQESSRPLVLAMDEVESIFDTDFRSDFFSMLRSWHNSRAFEPIWKQIDLMLVTSTEPYQLIENLNQSPFNVGEVIDLADFTPEQVADLNRRHSAPFAPHEEQRLLALLGGHPYLVRRALYLVASRRLTAVDLFATATADRGPFGDHLRYHLFRLHDKPALVEGLLQAIHQGACPDERVFFRLRGAGLVRREGGAVLPRCQLYADYFRERLHAH
jgi:hypothetical protein